MGVVLALTVNLVSGMIRDFWDGKQSAPYVRYEKRSLSQERPGYIPTFFARTLLRIWCAGRGSSSNLLDRTERLVTWLMHGDPNTVQIVRDEVLEKDILETDQLSYLFWVLPGAAATRFCSLVGQLSGALVGVGTLVIVPLHLTRRPLAVVPASTDQHWASGVGYMLVTLGLIRWAMAARKDPTFGLNRPLREAITFLGMGIPTVLLTSSYIAVADVAVGGGMAVSWLGCMLLIAQASPMVDDVVRRAGLVTLSVGLALVSLGDMYWLYYSLANGRWLWTTSMLFLVGGAALGSITAGLATYMQPTTVNSRSTST